jgi:uncharacterized membrane protein
VLAPVVATYLILRLVFNFLVDLVDPLTDLAPFTFVPDRADSWLALGVLAVIVYLAGLLATKVLGGRLVSMANRVVEAIPGVRVIYRMARQATEVLAGSNSQHKYRRVVIVDFPRKGLKTIGLVTGRLTADNGRPMFMLYIPTAPNPTSGFTALVPEDEVISTDMSVEDAMKLVVSGGVVFPDEMSKYTSEARDERDHPQ